jgi:hypothetical protein
MKVKGFFVFGLVLFFMLLPVEPSLAQCAMCKQSAESTLKNNPSSIARGLNSGILYLMAVPYLAIMFIFRKQIASLVRKLHARYFKKTQSPTSH